MSAVPCPTPGKMVFDTRAAARSAAKWTEQKHTVAGQLRPYRCRCGRWHLTRFAGKKKQLDRRRRRSATR